MTEYISKIKDNKTSKTAYLKDEEARQSITNINSQLGEIVNELGRNEDGSEIALQTTVQNIRGAINEVDSQLGELEKVAKDNIDKIKAIPTEYVKKGQVDLDDMTEKTLQAIQGGEETSFSLLSIPRDNSVTAAKTDFLKSTVSHNLANFNNIVQNKKVPMTKWLCQVAEVDDENFCYLAVELEEGNYILNTGISGKSFVTYTGVKGSDKESKLDGSITITGSPATLAVSGGVKKYFFNMIKTDYEKYVTNNGYLCLMKQSDYDTYGFEEYNDGKIIFTDKFNNSIGEALLDESLRSVVDNSKKEFVFIDVKDRILETLTDRVINWDGNIGNLSGWEVKLIQLNLGEKLIVKGNLATGDSSHIGMLEVFSNKTPWKVHYKVGDYSTNAMEHIATKNTEYLYVVCKDTFEIKIESPNKQEIYNMVGLNQIELLRYRFNTAICIGDSLTVGKQPNDSSRECYPSYLAKMTDMTITNAGQSGATANNWFTTWKDTYNYSNYECAFICFGTNGGVIQNSDNYNAYISLINKMRKDNPDIVIFLLDCVGNNSDGTDANAVIKKIAQDNQCHFLQVFKNNQYSLQGIHGSSVSAFHDLEGDPTHLSPMGYLFMARNIVCEMTKTMSENISMFNQRHQFTKK